MKTLISAEAGRALNRRRVAGFFLTLVLTAAFARPVQGQYRRIKSFGFGESSAANPAARLIVASDGALYGTTTLGGTNNLGTVFTVNQDGSGFRALHSFSQTNADGANPGVGVIEGSDGALYGVTANGGANGAGTVFRINKDGGGYATIHSFSFALGDARLPEGDLIEAVDGALYGTTYAGGENAAGTVFKVGKTGGGYSIVHSFSYSGAVGASPQAGLLLGSDGLLYGTTYAGGSNGVGVAFSLKPDGSDYVVLHGFGASSSDGENPEAALLEGADGVLYGTTYAGGVLGLGTIFKVNKDGSGYAVIHNLRNDGGANPVAALVEGADGALYGTTSAGGALGFGAVFKINKNGNSYTVLRNLAGGPGDGKSPQSSVALGPGGVLFGSSHNGGLVDQGTIFRLNANGTGYTILLNFTATGGDGQNPQAALTLGRDGALWGTTAAGGPNGFGTAFRINQDGSDYQLLHSFLGVISSDGSQPQGALLQTADGFWYGATATGGNAGAGTIFQLRPDGSGYSIVVQFGHGNGSNPTGGLIQGTDGALYGTLPLGGDHGLGAVFRLDLSLGGLTIIHSFCGLLSSLIPICGRDGDLLDTPVVQGSDGALYGSTSYGGYWSAGSIFTIREDGSGYAIIHDFAEQFPIYYPQAGIVEGLDGTLYGGDLAGGTNQLGSVFKLHHDGSGYTVLHSFSGPDGSQVPRSVLYGQNGVLYGVATAGGAGSGTLFQLSSDGSNFALLRTFAADGADGAAPQAGLIQAADGTVFGVTSGGGEFGFGTIFAYHPQVATAPRILSLTPVAGRTIVRLVSAGGSTNLIQRANAVMGPWTTLTNLIVPSGGIADFTDPAPALPNSFYRAERTGP